MHLILTGATGVVGSGVLNHILHHGPSAQITKLTILSRNPSIPLLTTQKPPPSLQVEVLTHADFLSYPSSLLSTLSTADGVIWALGISQTQVSAETYTQITRDYTLAAAKAFGSNPSKPQGKLFKFVYVSGEGATTTPGRFTPIFGRVKGETEAALLALNASAECPDLRIFNARPGGVDPVKDPAVAEATAAKRGVGIRRLEPVFMPLFRTFYASMTSPTQELGRVLTELAVGGGESIGKGPGVSGEGRTLANVALRRMAGI